MIRYGPELNSLPGLVLLIYEGVKLEMMNKNGNVSTILRKRRNGNGERSDGQQRKHAVEKETKVLLVEGIEFLVTRRWTFAEVLSARMADRLIAL